MVDFVINLPYEQVDRVLQDRMPGGGRDRFADDLRGRESKSRDTDSQVLSTNWSWAHRYVRLSDNRTEVQLWFYTGDWYIRTLIDEYLSHIWARFPEARFDLCTALEDEHIARLLPELMRVCGEWRDEGYVGSIRARDPMSDELAQRLTNILGDRYDGEELKNLCHDLGIDYEELPGRKSAFVRELIRYCGRHRKLPELVAVGRLSRPDIDWPQIS